MKGPVLGFLILAFVFYAGVQKIRGKSIGDGICVGVGCGRHEIKRTYQAETLEFKVAGPYEIRGKTLSAVHTFKLGAFQTLKGTGFGFHNAPGNDYGQDQKHFYLPPDRLAFYHAEFLQPGKPCPSSFMHQNMRIYILVGADPSISERLRTRAFKIEYGGTPFAYEGHFMTYDSSLADGESSQLVPAQFESAFSNVGHANIPYDYFLVTGIATPDPPLANPDGRKPEKIDLE